MLEIDRPGSEFDAWTFEYDALGNQTTANYGDGDIHYTYDELGRVIQIEYPAISGEEASSDPIRIETLKYKFYDNTSGYTGSRRTVTSTEVTEGVGTQIGVLEQITDPMGRLRQESWVIPGFSDSSKPIKMMYD